MEGYLIWLAYLALAIMALSAIQLQIGRNRRLQMDCRKMQIDVQRLEGELRVRENNIDRLLHDQNLLLKWKDRASELEGELRATKQSKDYASAQRLQYLEDYLASQQKDPPAMFVGTSPSRGLQSFEDCLRKMLERAEFEVVIVSPGSRSRCGRG